MPKRVKLELSHEDEATLKMWADSGTTEHRFILRAEVILLASQGLSLREISEKTGLHQQNCYKWRKRFENHGLDGLADKPGRGRKPVITPEERANVIATACTEPVDGSNRWSVRKLAEVSHIGKSTVQQILSEASIKLHKTE